jgi:hypothetical protein
MPVRVQSAVNNYRGKQDKLKAATAGAAPASTTTTSTAATA